MLGIGIVEHGRVGRQWLGQIDSGVEQLRLCGERLAGELGDLRPSLAVSAAAWDLPMSMRRPLLRLVRAAARIARNARTFAGVGC